MNCKKAKNLFFLYKELTPSENEIFISHLRACDSCNQEFQSYQDSLKLVGQNLVLQEPQNDWDEYWHKLSRHISKKSAWGKAWDRVTEWLSTLARPVYGPVPAYAVSLVLVILLLSLYPLVNNKSQVKFESSLVVQQSKLIAADVQGSVTVYKLAQK